MVPTLPAAVDRTERYFFGAAIDAGDGEAQLDVARLQISVS